MPFWKILLVGLGAELILLGAGMSFMGLGGGATAVVGAFSSGWFDLLNTFLPFWLALNLLGLGLIAAVCERRRGRTVLLLVGACGLVVAATPIGLELAARAGVMMTPPGTGARLRVMTFNSFDDNFAPGRTIEAIYKTAPDLVALQEPRNFNYFSHELNDAYPYRTDCSNDCRVLILSKRPLIKAKLFKILGSSIGPMRKFGEGNLDLAQVEVIAPDGKPVTLVTTHMIWPAPPLPKRRQLEVLAAYVRGLPKDRLIVTGDFNLTPWTFSMRREDRALRPLRRVTRALPTWPAVVPRFNIPFNAPFLPIDHVYAGPGWRSAQVSRLAGAGSDHYPVLIDLFAP